MGRGVYLLLQIVVMIRNSISAAAKSNDMSSTLRPHVVEGENQLSDKHYGMRVHKWMCTHSHTNYASMYMYVKLDNVDMFIILGCHRKMQRLKVYKQQQLFLTVLKPGKPRSKLLTGGLSD